MNTTTTLTARQLAILALCSSMVDANIGAPIDGTVFNITTDKYPLAAAVHSLPLVDAHGGGFSDGLHTQMLERSIYDTEKWLWANRPTADVHSNLTYGFMGLTTAEADDMYEKVEVFEEALENFLPVAGEPVVTIDAVYGMQSSTQVFQWHDEKSYLCLATFTDEGYTAYALYVMAFVPR